ncbi:Uncharacterised protein [Mycobacteroides abscessus subsp. abscessus]|nr:Uncharacterised protein [Mycobacteroides abscessus subsp. abscessus]
MHAREYRQVSEVNRWLSDDSFHRFGNPQVAGFFFCFLRHFSLLSLVR